MQPTDTTAPQIGEIIQKGTSGIVVLPLNPSADAVAAGTAIYLALTKLGKSISLISESPSRNTELVGADKVQSEVSTSGSNLVISFPYSEGAIDKVDYNITGNTFNLIIVPRNVESKLDTKKVSYTYSGGSIDFIITIDAPNLQSLGNSFTQNKEQFQNKPIINIDRHLVNDFYGTINLVNKTSSSVSELALKFLDEVGTQVDRDAASNLYMGLLQATNNFTSYSVNADTFQTASQLLKMGAVKKQIQKPVSQPQQQSQQSQNSGPRNDRNNDQRQQNFAPKKPTNQQNQQPQQQQRPVMQQSAPQKPPMNDSDYIKPIESVEKEPMQNPDPEEQDWLKPKIFRGTGLI